MVINMAFSEKLKIARMQSGLSQAALAAKLDISLRTVKNYESGRTLPPSDKLVQIAKFFAVSVDSLVSEGEVFVKDAYERGGSRGASEAKALVDEVSGLFSGGRLSEEDMDATMKAIQNAYWIAKEESKRKYTPKKFREGVKTE